MMTTVQLKLGQAANLLFGYRPTWDFTKGSCPFFEPPTTPVETLDAVVEPGDDTTWSSYPTLTLHTSAASVVSAVYRYGLAPMAGEPKGLSVPAGPLVLDDADAAAAAAAVSRFLGLELSEGLSYMLVTMKRVAGTATHEFVSDPSSKHRESYLTPAAQDAIAQLVPSEPLGDGSVLYDAKITEAEAADYVSAIYQLGTHFVTEITAGDMLVQVFAYQAKPFKVLARQFLADAKLQPDGTMAVTGAAAMGYRNYIGPVKGQYGYVKEYGGLVALSRDPKLTAAIAAGAWADPNVPQGTPSIFAGGQDNNLLNDLTEVVPYGLTMMPLAALFADMRRAWPWEHLVKGALLQKYGDAITVPISRVADYDWAELFPEASDSWASPIVTPTIDIFQERVDLSKVQLQGANVLSTQYSIKSFTVFAQILQATGSGDSPIPIPSDDVTLIAQIIDTTQSEKTPVLSLTANAFRKVKVSCEEMYGALIFENSGSGSNERRVALDGYLFETDSTVDPTTKRLKVSLSGVLSEPPDPALIPQLTQSIQFSIVAGESLLYSRGPGSKTVRELEQAYLLWLGNLIPKDTTDPDLAAARAQALYLARIAHNLQGDGVYVPYVTYEGYQKFVGDLVSEAGTLQRQIQTYQIQITDTVNAFKVMDDIAALNDNVKAIGGVLTKYFGVLAEGREAMGGYYSQILEQLQKDFTQTVTDMEDLNKKLAAQQKVISFDGTPQGIVQKFEEDYASWEADQVFKAVMSAVTGLFDVALAFSGIPGAAEKGVLDALKAMKATFDKIQKVMEILKQLESIEKKVGKGIKSLNALSNSIVKMTGDLEMPTQLELTTFAENVKAALVNVPQSGSLNQDKANLIAAVNTLVNQGSALLDARARASQIQLQIINENRLKEINSSQQGKLNALTDALHLGDVSKAPDVNSIDLIGLTGQLQFQLKQVLSVLARTLALQDGALQFEYFGEPTPITSFSLFNLQHVMTAQDQQILKGVQNLNPQPQKVPDPIKYTVKGVRVGQLSGSNTYEFAIQPGNTPFWDYDMVRIDRVVANVSGIKKTDSGKYEVHLTCQGRPFVDRDYQRQLRTYYTVERKFGPTVYEISTGKIIFGGNGGTFDAQVTHLTPFSHWEISLPGSVQNNQGIEFDGPTVDLELEFHVTAHYDDPVKRAALAAGTRLAAATTAGPSLATLEDQMYQNQAVLQGWDAVFSVMEGPVNAFLNQQFQQYISKLNPQSKNVMELDALYCNGLNHLGSTYFTTVTKLSFKLSNPLLQFLEHNPNEVQVRQYILSGTVTTGPMIVAQKGFSPQSCKLTVKEVTFTAATVGNKLTLSADGYGVWSDNMQVKLETTGTLPAPLQPDTDYWIVGWDKGGDNGPTTLQLSESAGGTAIDLTDQGSGTQTIYPDIQWGDPNTVDTSSKPYVLAQVALTKIDGIVDPPSGQGDKSDTHTVVLDFPAGSFTLNQIKVKDWNPAPEAAAISEELRSFFATHEIKYQVQTINYSNLNKDKALQPTQFKIQTMNTNAGNSVLQFFIATTGNVKSALTINVNEPIPYDPENPVPGSSDYLTSLMVGTQIMFQNIFVDSFNSGPTGMKVEAVAPPEDFKTWSAKLTEGNATGVVPFKDEYKVPNCGTVRYRISASGNSLTWDLKGMKFQRSQAAGLEFAYSNGTASPPTGGTKVAFEWSMWHPPHSDQYGNYYPGYWGAWTKAHTMAYVNIDGSYPLEVTGAGAEQVVKFTTDVPDVEVQKSSDLKPQSDCACNDQNVKIALMQSLADSVPKQLKSYIGKITFKPISVLALENLLFPAEQLITMQQARVPGDLLVVGSFLFQVRKTAPNYDVTISAAAGCSGEFGGTTFENGKGTGSATQSDQPASFSFKYGPTNGSLTTYRIDIEKGTISPNLLVVVDQPDPKDNPAEVILLPPVVT